MDLSQNITPPRAPCGAKSKKQHEDNDGYDNDNKGIGDAGSTADLRMLWSAIVCLGLGLL